MNWGDRYRNAELVDIKESNLSACHLINDDGSLISTSDDFIRACATVSLETPSQDLVILITFACEVAMRKPTVEDLGFGGKSLQN